MLQAAFFYPRAIRAHKWGRVWNSDQNLVTETKISILDSKTNMFLSLFILGLYHAVLNIIQEKGNLDRTCNYFLNSGLSFPGVWNPQTKHSPFFF